MLYEGEFQKGACLFDEALLSTGDNCHKQSAVSLNSCMYHEFPTILSTANTEQTQNACPSGLWESVIVLFGISNSSLGVIIGLQFCTEGTIIWLF